MARLKARKLTNCGLVWERSNLDETFAEEYWQDAPRLRSLVKQKGNREGKRGSVKFNQRITKFLHYRMKFREREFLSFFTTIHTTLTIIKFNAVFQK